MSGRKTNSVDFTLASTTSRNNNSGDESKRRPDLSPIIAEAESGNVSAMKKMGTYLHKGWGVAVDHARAFKYFKMASDLGDVDSLNTIGVMYRDGQGVEKDPAAAFKCFESAAARDHVGATFNLAGCFWDGVGVARDPTKAVPLLEKAAAAGKLEALHTLARCFQLGMGVAKDLQRAFQLFEKAANNGYAVSKCDLADFYLDGIAVPKDTAKALILYQEAADVGSLKAMVTLGNHYLRGDGVKKDVRKAVEWLQQAADSGELSSMFTLSQMHELGEDVPLDMKKAQSLLECSAKGGYPPAMTKLGNRFLNGFRVPKDPAKGVELLQKAADAGDLEAKSDLAHMNRQEMPDDSCYRERVVEIKNAAERGSPEALESLGLLTKFGKLVDKDPELAFSYFKRADEAGQLTAAAYVALCYEYGEGVPKDLAKAEAYYNKLYDNGRAAVLLLTGKAYELGDPQAGVEKDASRAFAIYRRAALLGVLSAQARLQYLSQISHFSSFHPPLLECAAFGSSLAATNFPSEARHFVSVALLSRNSGCPGTRPIPRGPTSTQRGSPRLPSVRQAGPAAGVLVVARLLAQVLGHLALEDCVVWEVDVHQRLAGLVVDNQVTVGIWSVRNVDQLEGFLAQWKSADFSKYVRFCLIIQKIQILNECTVQNSMMAGDYLVFKCLIIGDSGVGKSSLLGQFVEKTFSPSRELTVGVEFASKMLSVEGQSVKLQIWDLAGRERFRSIVRAYFRGSKGILMCYDVSSRPSFQAIPHWQSEVQNLCQEGVAVILVGTKSDLDKREVSYEEASNFAKQFGMEYCETSAASGFHVEDVFERTTQFMLQSYRKSEESNS
ncbi:serine/threonine protein kinase [Pelomyxa schiedti]|nr:serine/threonine protein kinase [Pelomyxa schiedti]